METTAVAEGRAGRQKSREPRSHSLGKSVFKGKSEDWEPKGETEAERAKWEESQPGHCGRGSQRGSEFHAGVSHSVRCRERG